MNARLKQWMWGLAGAAALAAAFIGYLRPGFVVDLANRIVLCF